MNNTHVEHGVFMDIFGAGILIRGASGIGKSEVALSLINHGHRLIADDTTEFCRHEDNLIYGRCPEVLQDFLEVRGLGILNIRAIFGDIAVEQTKPLQLIVQLTEANPADLQGDKRLFGLHTDYVILGVTIPQVTIPVAAGRNVDILVEAAVRNQMLRLRGYDASHDLSKRQRKQIERSEICD